MAQGVPVVTLMSDIGDIARLHYTGIDNVHAGRTAGHFIGKSVGNFVGRLAEHSGKDIVGLYQGGAGSAGIAAALVRHQRAHDVVWVGHELSDEHRELLALGHLDLAIDQDPDGQVLSAVQHLLHACGYLDAAPAGGPNEFRLFCAENLPARPYLQVGWVRLAVRFGAAWSRASFGHERSAVTARSRCAEYRRFTA